MVLAAHHHAHRALQNFVSDDRFELLDAAVSAGTALELTAKAAIAQIEPTLLADRTDRDTLLMLSGNGQHAEARATRIRTVGALAAFQLVRHFHKSIAIAESAAREVFETRNAAAHIGIVDRTEVRAATSTMSRAVDSILIAMGADRASFWGGRVHIVDGLIQEQRETVAQIVAAKLAAARERVASISAGLSPEIRQTLLSALSRKTVSSDHEEPITCPACGQQAWLVCGVEEGEAEWESDPDAPFDWISMVAYPLELDCSVCELSLDQAELAHLGLDSEFELEPREAYAADYEPDEDLWRGR